jgi:hypothetical protein
VKADSMKQALQFERLKSENHDLDWVFIESNCNEEQGIQAAFTKLEK